MPQNDAWIRKQAALGMIEPFEPSLKRLRMGRPALSYGTSSHGYDLRLSSKEFFVFHHVPGTIVDPKNFNTSNLCEVDLVHGTNGSYFVLPAHSYGLGVAVEKLKIPNNVIAVCLGKSTYARLGIIVNVTPAEAGWEGHLTLEFSNSSSADCRIYADEGVCQILFYESEPCEVDYQARNGKYQNQPEKVVFAKT